MDLVQRFAVDAVRTALSDTRVVAVNGARQVGKSTLARAIVAESPGALETSLDDAVTRATATADPTSFVRHDGLLLIDEVQRVPDLLLSVKAQVDRDPRPGRYLLTGSARLLGLPGLVDTLAGRIEVVELWPFSQGELRGRRERFVDDLFTAPEALRVGSDLGRDDYLSLAVRGGFPEMVARREGPSRSRWLEAYLRTLIGREVGDLARIDRLDQLPALVRLTGARTARLLNVAGVAADARLAQSTVRRYLTLLETVYVLSRVPAWYSSRTTRLTKAPKLVLTDSGFAAHLLGVSEEGLRRNGDLAGQVVETFVLGELRRQLGWAREQAALHHFRTEDGAEVDAVLETRDGRVAGVEVKSGLTVRGQDLRGLRRLASSARDAFVAGVVLYAGQRPLSFGDGLWAVPISSLWDSGR